MDAAQYAQFDEVADLVQDLFETLFRSSQDAPPPGKNAANGYFRGNLLDRIPKLKAGDIVPTDARLAKLVQARNVFKDSVHEAFSRNANHTSSIWRDSGIWDSTLTVVWKDLITFIVKAFEYYNSAGGDGQQSGENAKEQEALAKAISDLYDAVEKSGVIFSGTHCNGWISGGVDNAGEATQNLLPLADFADPPSDAIDHLGLILRAVATQYRAINNKNHNPWLRADWQVEFESYARIGYTSVRLLRLNEAERFAKAGGDLKGDAAKVAASQQHEVLHFAKRHNLTEDEVLSLISQVGNDRQTLITELAKRRIDGTAIAQSIDTRGPALPAG